MRELAINISISIQDPFWLYGLYLKRLINRQANHAHASLAFSYLIFIPLAKGGLIIQSTRPLAS